jgi:ubiquitin C-terminal hydrolase
MNSKMFVSYINNTNTSLTDLFSNDSSNVMNVYNIFIKQLSYSMPSYFKLNSQNDVHEFLMYFIDILYETQKKPFTIASVVKQTDSVYKRVQHKCNESLYNAYSPIMDVLYFQLVRQTSCSLCNNRNLNIENNFILEIDIVDNEDSVIKSIDRYFTTHVVADWTCDKCNLNSRENTIVHKMWMMPKTFIICVKRFKYLNGKMTKLNYSIDIPETLDFTKYGLQKRISHDYKLSGIINHLGNSYYGHYNADIIANGEMIKIDDDVIIKGKSLNEKNAYILFYEQS